MYISSEGLHCEWRIQSTHGERIVLNITEIGIPKSSNCKTDYLEVRDGYWHKSPVLKKLCGQHSRYSETRFVESITSTGSRMLVTYVAKTALGNSGFSASYEGTLFLNLHPIIIN